MSREILKSTAMSWPQPLFLLWELHRPSSLYVLWSCLIYETFSSRLSNKDHVSSREQADVRRHGFAGANVTSIKKKHKRSLLLTNKAECDIFHEKVSRKKFRNSRNGLHQQACLQKKRPYQPVFRSLNFLQVTKNM